MPLVEPGVEEAEERLLEGDSAALRSVGFDVAAEWIFHGGLLVVRGVPPLGGIWVKWQMDAPT